MIPALEDGGTAREKFEQRVCDLLHCDYYQQEIVCSTLHPYPVALVVFSPHSAENTAEVVVEKDGILSCHPALLREFEWYSSGIARFYVEETDMMIALVKGDYTIPGTEERKTVLTLQVLDHYGGE
jgi:hypothetical protein